MHDDEHLRQEFDAHRQVFLRSSKYLLEDARQANDQKFVEELLSFSNYLEALTFSPESMEVVDEDHPDEYVDRRIISDIESRFPQGHQWHTLGMARMKRGAKRLLDDARKMKDT